MSLAKVHHDIVDVLSVRAAAHYCSEIARVKRAAFRNDTYWGKPVPGFGDPNARVLVLGLAPAAHGANRTGRVFTGDGGGGSGDFLMTAMHRHGFASIPTSQSIDDGLQLTRRVHRRGRALRAAGQQTDAGRDRRVPVSPRSGARAADEHSGGGRAWENRVRCVVESDGRRGRRRETAAAHSLMARSTDPQVGPIVIASYHPSRQNTNTGKLTPQMMSSISGRLRSWPYVVPS